MKLEIGNKKLMGRNLISYFSLLCASLVLVSCAQPAQVTPAVAPTPAQVNAAEAQTHLDEAKTALRAGDLAKAQTEAKAATTANPQSSDAFYVLGNVYNQQAIGLADEGQRQDVFTKALEAYQKAISLNPKNDAALVNLGTVYYQNGQFDEALKNVQAGLAINPNDATTQYILGTIYLQQDPATKPGVVDSARAAFEKAIQLDPKMAVAYTGLATVLLFKNDYTNAKVNAQKAVDLASGSKDPYVYWALAQAQCQSNDFVNGAKTIALINSLNPQDARFKTQVQTLAARCK